MKQTDCTLDANALEDRNQRVLWLVVPCYNEAAALQCTPNFLLDEIGKLIDAALISDESRICFVDDGSTDATWELIMALARSNQHFCGISLSHNQGHQNALIAGLCAAANKCDAVITIDCDGQDDISAIGEMVKLWLSGDDIVYGVRNDRTADSQFKRLTAEVFYRFMEVLGVEMVFNHADYRLLDAKALNALLQFNEVNLFLRGIVPLLGFRTGKVYYKRTERIAGKSKYPLKSMMRLALNGVTSFSIRPIRMVSVLGLVFSIVGFAGVIWAIANAALGNATAGWASTICFIGFMGGMQMLCLGVLGEYIGKVYLEAKARPRFFVRERCGLEEADPNND